MLQCNSRHGGAVLPWRQRRVVSHRRVMQQNRRRCFAWPRRTGEGGQCRCRPAALVGLQQLQSGGTVILLADSFGQRLRLRDGGGVVIIAGDHHAALMEAIIGKNIGFFRSAAAQSGQDKQKKEALRRFHRAASLAHRPTVVDTGTPDYADARLYAEVEGHPCRPNRNTVW